MIASIMLLSCNRKVVVEDLPHPPKYLPSQEVDIEVEKDVIISGTLEYVSSKHLVVIIAGSGPTDRDCNSSLGIKTNAYKMLANTLSQHGISSYRYDKRGIGKSTLPIESDLVISTYVNDVISILKHLSSDFEEIILLGHSEGALIGSIASLDENVHSFIAVCGVSESVDKIIIDQLKSIPNLAMSAKKHINEIMNDEPLSEVVPELQSAFRPSVAPYLKSLFEIDPIVAMSKVEKPTLIIGGGCDVQVPTDHAKELDNAASDSKLLIINNMGHVLKNLEDDCGNSRSAYGDPSIDLNLEFAKAILSFIGCEECP